MKQKHLLTLLFCLLVCFTSYAEEVTIGTGTDWYTAAQPFGGSKYSCTQAMYSKDEIGSIGTINSISFYCGTAISNCETESVNIYMTEATGITYSSSGSSYTGGDMTLVYSGSPTLCKSIGWQTFSLTNPYYYDGLKNLVIVIETKYKNYTTSRYTSTSGTRQFLYRGDSTTEAYSVFGNDWSYEYSSSYNRPNIKLSIYDSKSLGVIDGIEYMSTSDNQCMIKDGSNATGDISILNNLTVDGTFYVISSMKEKAFDTNKNITSVDFSLSNIKIIPNQAFAACGNLKSVNFNGVNIIDREAFYCCSSLESIEIPSSLSKIGNTAFADTYNLKSLRFDNSSTTLQLGREVFYQNYKNVVTDAYIGRLLTTTDTGGPLNNIGHMGKVSFASSCTTIDPNFFGTYTGYIDDLTLSSSIKSIANDNFNGWTIKKLTIEDGNTSLPVGYKSNSSSSSYYYGVFSDCRIDTLYLGRQLTYTPRTYNSYYQGYGVPFEKNTTLKSVTIGSNVKSIGSNFFYGCTNLNEVMFNTSNATISLAGSIFKECPIEKVHVGRILSCTSSLYSEKPFYNKHTIKTVTFNDGLTTISDSIFQKCDSISTITIPSTIKKIGKYAFEGCIGIESINGVTDNIQCIGDEAFAGCINLGGISLPANLTSLGASAFYNCRKIDKIVIPATLKKIPTSAFSQTSIKELTIPATVDNIGDYAFSRCQGMAAIKFEDADNTLILGSDCFANDTLNTVYLGRNLTNSSIVFTAYDKINIGKKVNTLCSYLFYGYRGSEITVPKTVTTIGNNIFSTWKSNIKKITFEDGNTPLTVGYVNGSRNGVAYKAGICYDMNVDSLYVGRDLNWTKYDNGYVQYVGYTYGAPFEKLSHLKYVEYGDSVTNIAEYTFQGCDSLKVARLGKSIQTMSNPFSDSGLDSLYVTMPTSPSGNPGYVYAKSADNNSYLKKIITYVPSGTAADYRSRWNSQCIIMDDSEDIVYAILNKPGTLASKIIAKGLQTKNVAKLKINGELNDTDWELLKRTNMPYLTYLDLSEVTNDSIPSQMYGSSSAYSFDNTLNTLILPENLKRIGDYAFSGCVSLGGEIVLPQSLRKVGNCAMRYTNYTSLSVPSEDCAIDSCAFTGCKKLKSVEIGSGSILGTKAFYNCSNLNRVTLGNNAVIGAYAYQATPIANLTLGENTTIGKYAFQNCNKITSLVIPGDGTTIGDYAFYGLGYLDSLSIKEGVTSIGNYAFYSSYNDPAFKGELTIPSSVKSIGNYAFYGWKNMTKLTFGDDAESIGDYAFYNCANIDSLYLPRELKTLGNYAFCGGTRIKYVDVPAKIESFGQNYGSFINCDSIVYIKSHAENPVDILSSSFTSNVYKNATLYVPEDAAGNYLTATGWKSFENIREFESTEERTKVNLVDGESYTNAFRRKNTDITYTRTFNNIAWQALYIPFSMSYSNWAENFEVAYVNGIRQQDTDGDGVIDYQVMDVIKIKNGTLKPNTPYLIKAKEIGEKTISVSDATLYASAENSIDCSTTVAKYIFTGTYSTISAATMTDNNYYAMGEGTLRPCTSDLKPFRWCMKMESRDPMVTVPSDSNAKININVIGEEDEVTGIKTIYDTESNNVQCWDITGRKVTDSYKGLVIKNGKKFINK